MTTRHVKCGMTRAFLAVAAAGAALLAACGGGSTLSEAEWAAAVCRVAEELEASAAGLDDGVDPTSLSFDERLARAKARWPQVAAVFEEARAGLNDVSPPRGARGYHEALVKQLDDIVKVFGAVGEEVEDARTHEHIEALNARINIVVERTQREEEEALADLSDDAAAALRGITNCGAVT